MVLPPLPPPTSNGYDLDQLLQIVSNLEGAGLLEEFIRAHPQYLIGVEVARAILQRSRSNNVAVRGIGPVPSPPQVISPLACIPASVPSAPSVRHFVTLISQLLEELCPNRNDPNIISCEDRCLAALQMAVVHCLKVVRQRRLVGPQQQPAIGYQQQQSNFPQQRSQGYQQFNPAAAGGAMSFPPQQGAGFTPQMQNGMGAPQQMMGNLDQRLNSIPQPSPCGMHSAPHNTVSSFIQRPPLVGTLEQRLAAIPEPPLCHQCAQGLPVPAAQTNNSCGGGYGFGTYARARRQQEDTGLAVKLFPPVAGGMSDGLGGHKIKGFAGQANTDRDAPSGGLTGGGTSPKNAGNSDGMGGTKIRGMED